MNSRIVVAGSEGLVGRALRATLRARGNKIVGLDLRGLGSECGDVLDSGRMHSVSVRSGDCQANTLFVHSYQPTRTPLVPLDELAPNRQNESSGFHDDNCEKSHYH